MSYTVLSGFLAAQKRIFICSASFPLPLILTLLGEVGSMPSFSENSLSVILV